MQIYCHHQPYKPPIELTAGVSDIRINQHSPIVGYKTGNYLEKLLALTYAHQKGWGEALQFNLNDHLCSAVMGNVFLVSKGQWVTPALQEGCLPGIMRQQIMQQKNAQEIMGITYDTVKSADNIYVSSCLKGLVPLLLV